MRYAKNKQNDFYEEDIFLDKKMGVAFNDRKLP